MFHINPLKLYLGAVRDSMTDVWGCPGGMTATGLAGRATGLRFRDAFLGTVAASALSLAFGGPALAGPDACTPSGGGTIETCSGNQSAGIASGTDFTAPPVTTLNVNNLNQAIAPGIGAPGISFVSADAITITSNTGAFGITTANARGIYATGPLAVVVTSTGNIATTGANAQGIFAISIAATVTSTGNISSGGNGIDVQAFNVASTATVTSTGNITAGANGINAYNQGGNVVVTSAGNITAGGFGIRAFSAGGGAVTVTSTGNISAQGGLDGIYARNQGAGAVAVTSTGNISTQGIRVGIRAQSSDGAVTVSSTGNITTVGAQAYGIAAGGGNGAVTVNSTGNITTAGSGAHGIFATSFASAVTVTSTGNITATGNGAFGIYAVGSNAPIAVTIKSGTVSGGTGTGGGVGLAAGSNNTLTNMGTITALSGVAIIGNTTNNTVNNFGTVIGNVLLAVGSNAINNMAGGVFNAGATVNLGTGTLTNAGTFSPGGAGVIQTTALSGNLVQSTTGRFLTDINVGGATSDRVNVSGTANLAGVVQLQVSNLTVGAWQQTVLSATGGTTINGLSLLASPALQAQLVFPNATDVVVKSAGVNFAVAGLNTNQTAVGNALNNAAQGGGFGGPIFNLLLNATPTGYGLALNQLTGEAATGTQQTTFDAMNLFMSTMLDPFNRGTTSTPGGGANGYASEGDASAYASDGRKRTPAERDAYAMFTKAPPQNFEARWSVWAAGFGGSQTTDSNAAVGSNGATSRIAGTAVGADYIFSPNTIAGFALAGGGTGYTVGNGLGSGRSDLFQAGVYARHTMGAAYIAGALAYGWQDITTNRTVTLAGLDQLQARFNANAYSGRVEGGYRLVSPWIGGIGITPYGAAQFTTFDLPAYAEQAVIGTNNFALAYGAKSVTDPRSEVGFRTDKSYIVQDGVLTLRSRFAWAHDYDPGRSIGATFQSLPGASFVVNGAAQASDSVLTTASVEMKWRNNWSIAATFEGEFSSVTSSYAGKGTVRYQW
jgi:uncharacterized protein with beta-barrel porin domain